MVLFTLPADLSCAQSVTDVIVNGLRRTHLFITGLGPSGAIKVTALRGFNASNANRAEVCIRLQPPCTTLNQLCRNGACRTAFYTDDSIRVSG